MVLSCWYDWHFFPYFPLPPTPANSRPSHAPQTDIYLFLLLAVSILSNVIPPTYRAIVTCLEIFSTSCLSCLHCIPLFSIAMSVFIFPYKVHGQKSIFSAILVLPTNELHFHHPIITGYSGVYLVWLDSTPFVFSTH